MMQMSSAVINLTVASQLEEIIRSERPVTVQESKKNYQPTAPPCLVYSPVCQLSTEIQTTHVLNIDESARLSKGWTKSMVQNYVNQKRKPLELSEPEIFDAAYL